jgi:hypothetical protein
MFDECRHVKPSGIKCKSPALRSTPFCYFHSRLDRSRNPSVTDHKLPIQLPSLEDFNGIQIALHQILEALSTSRIDARRASLFLRGLRIAADLAAKSPSIAPSEFVRDLSYQNDGSSLALEKSTCEPPEDCFRCNKREDCQYFEDHEDDFEEVEEDAEEGEEQQDEEEGREKSKEEELSASPGDQKASIDTSPGAPEPTLTNVEESRAFETWEESVCQTGCSTWSKPVCITPAPDVSS